MAHNDPRRRLPPSQIPGHQLYPLLSQLTPLPNLAHIKHENPGGIPGIHNLATSHHAVVPGKTQCPICHSYFSKNTDLKRHIETVHEGQKTQCPTCQALFSRKTDLKRHIETVHEGKRTHCHLCSASFSRKTDLKRHVETVHEGKRTQCPNCSASFSRKTGLKQNIETIHEGKKTPVLNFYAKSDFKRHSKLNQILSLYINLLYRENNCSLIIQILHILRLALVLIKLLNAGGYFQLGSILKKFRNHQS